MKNIKLEDVDVRGGSYVGGLGSNLDGSIVENSYASGNVSGNEYVGGLVGDS